MARYSKPTQLYAIVFLRSVLGNLGQSLPIIIISVDKLTAILDDTLRLDVQNLCHRVYVRLSGGLLLGPPGHISVDLVTNMLRGVVEQVRDVKEYECICDVVHSAPRLRRIRRRYIGREVEWQKRLP